MKFQLFYFDDQIQNIEVYQTMLKDSFEITGIVDGTKYEEAMNLKRPHGIMLDLHMPIMDGITLYEKIVKSPNYNGCPIFFISGDLSDESRIRTIETGAIDFFNRQITEEELRLRLISKIKIFLKGASSLEIGNLRFDSNLFLTYVNNKPINLTLVEMRILSCVMRAMPDPVNKAELLEKIWVDNPKQGKIHVHLSNMKMKLWDWTHEMRIRDNFISIAPIQ